MRATTLGLALVLTLGCEIVDVPDPTDLNGTWTYSISDLHATKDRAPGVTCRVDGVTLHLTHAPVTRSDPDEDGAPNTDWIPFTGTYRGGTVTCTSMEPFEFAEEQGTLSGAFYGDVEHTLVGFELDGWGHRGAGYNSTTMGGEVNWGVEACNDYYCYTDVVITGRWQATRVDAPPAR